MASKNTWSPIPEPALNGGLYNGQPFASNAPWANTPVRPSSAYLTHVNLRSAQPPAAALYQMQAGYRPGNNSDDPMPGVQQFTGDQNYGPFDFYCVPCAEKNKAVKTPGSCQEKVVYIP
jgi:hypothetical protein